MNKLLLATAAILGATPALAMSAYAQSANATATLGTVTSQSTLANPLTPQPAPKIHASATHILPALGPNSFEVHLDGRLNWYAGIARGSLDNSGSTKTAPYDLQGYIRLYPGFTAEMANGLQYGVAAEARMPGSTGGKAGISPGATSSGETLFWQRAYGFVATPTLGTLRFGMGDGVIDLYQIGTFENFNSGAWKGDEANFILKSETPDFLIADVGALYASNKVVYLSPNFSGFEFGVDFTPNTANLYNDSGCGTGSAGMLTCNRLSSQGLEANYGRPRNEVGVGVKYTHKFGEVGFAASTTYLYSGVVENTTPAPITYSGLSVGAAGLTVSYAGFTVGGRVVGGEVNKGYNLRPDGARNGLWWIAGAEYRTGPLIVGASYFQYQEAGNWLPGRPVGRTENDTGLAVGATYDIAPGFDLFASYLYGTKHQADWNFATGAVGPDSNNTHAQLFALGTQLSW